MSGKKTLADFHFDPVKSGKTLNHWQESARIGSNYIVKETGITAERLKNNKRGEIMDPKLEVIFKLSVICGRGVDGVIDYLRDQLEGEELAFDPGFNPVPIAPDVATSPCFQIGYIDQLKSQIAELKESRAMLCEQYLAQLNNMEKQYRIHDEAMQAEHDKERTKEGVHFTAEHEAWLRACKHADEHIAQLRKSNLRLTLALCASVFLLFITLLIILLR